MQAGLQALRLVPHIWIFFPLKGPFPRKGFSKALELAISNLLIKGGNFVFKKVLDYAGEYRRLTYRSVAVLLLGVTMSVLPFWWDRASPWT